jgi:excisionase family DNA binding protein
MDELLTPREAAAKLRCSIKTLNGHVASGELRYVQIGQGKKRPRRRFTRSDLEALIQHQTREESLCLSSKTVGRHTRRFFGSTKATTRRAAEAVERAEREKARALVAAEQAASTSLRLDDIAGRYWQEIGQHHAAAANTWKQIERLVEFFGNDKLITEITGDDVAKLVAWRRGHRVERGGKKGALIGAFTVNTTEQLKKLFTRAKAWGVRRSPRRCAKSCGRCAGIIGSSSSPMSRVEL